MPRLEPSVEGDPGMNLDDQAAAQQMARVLCTHWKLTQSETDCLLGTADQAARVGLMLSIHKHLRELFPMNVDLAHGWMGQENGAFHGRRPVDVALDRGLPGFEAVLAYLSHAGQI